MKETPDPLLKFSAADSLKPGAARLLRQLEIIFHILAIAAAVMRHGLRFAPGTEHLELGLPAVFSMTFFCLSLVARYRWSLARRRFLQSSRVALALASLWLAGTVAIIVFAPLFPDELAGHPFDGWRGFLLLSELLVIACGLTGTLRVMRNAAAGGVDPALILVASFLLVIILGTALLMLPRARAADASAVDQEGAPLVTALFTATSATCVTGLVVENTGDYWSRTGQVIILGLFQIGGLGIMTFGAFFAVASGQGMMMRESATLRDLLESESLGDARRLVLTILLFTFTAELIGAVLISGLWSDRPAAEQAYFSAFHAVSAFCNAGFSLTENSFAGLGDRWQVWGVVAGLIIIGGLGFAVIYNVVLVVKVRFAHSPIRSPLFNLPAERLRLSLSSKLVLITTAVLLVAGAAGCFLLESTGPKGESNSPAERIGEAWFQSVTFRTAGFNTVDHGELQPSTKLFAIGLMFIGASPGSTGGGVKTICFAIMFLALLAVLRGRNQVEIMGRRIPPDLINRSLTIITLGMVGIMCATLLLLLFEKRPGHFIDYMFEASSAFGTVGVSSSVEVRPGEFVSTTMSLTTPSRLVIIVLMFLGRVGPLTLLIALAGRTQEARYEYPEERVTLG